MLRLPCVFRTKSWKHFKIKIMNRIYKTLAICLLIASCSTNSQNDKVKYIDNEQKIDSIMSLMTIEEKIGQMTQIDQQFLDTIQDIAEYGIGSLLSGGGSHPDTNHFDLGLFMAKLSLKRSLLGIACPQLVKPISLLNISLCRVLRAQKAHRIDHTSK